MSLEPGSGLTPSGYGHMRSAQADRERAIDVLRAAFAEGRLDKDEFAERVGQVHTSRTYGELAELTADLPAGPLGTLVPASGPIPVPARPEAEPAPRTSALAVLSLGLGIAAAFVPVMFLLGVPAALLGLVAMARIGPKRRGGLIALLGVCLGVFGYFGLIP
jgi:hypothetical protein